MSTAVAPTATSASFTGSDVDGLDKLAQDFTQAAQVCDEVKAACEVIVAASFIFGPFGAAFVAYLKGTVIPWLTKISEALQLMAKVLSFRSQAQKDASSASTSLPAAATYQTPSGLPATSAAAAPAAPAAVGSTTSAVSTQPSAGASAGSTVATPPAIGSTTAAAAAHTTPGAASTASATQVITAVTGLLTAIGKLTGTDPTALGATTAAGVTPIAASGTVPSITDLGTTPTTTATTSTIPGGVTSNIPSGTDLGSAGSLSSLPGVTTGAGTGDAVGVLSVPVSVSPDGHITPLLHTTATPAGATTPISATTPSLTAHDPASATPIAHAATPVTGGGSGGGGLSGGGSGGGTGGGSGGGMTAAPASATPLGSMSALPAAQSAVTHALGATTAHAAAGLPGADGASASHDGLYSGLGQATGIGAGAAALARAGVHELRQRSDGGLIGAVTLPFDSAADGSAAARVFDGELGG